MEFGLFLLLNSLDGAGLFCGVIQYLLGLKNESNGTSATPKVLAATHFHEIFHSNLLDESLPIDFVHMEAMLSKGSGPASDLRDAAESIEMDEEHGLAREESAQIQIHHLYRLASIPHLRLHCRFHMHIFAASPFVSLVGVLFLTEVSAYIYSVAKGLSLNSHATKCALMYGIPKAIVERAEHVR